MILVAVPVLERPHRAKLVADAVHSVTTTPHRVVFFCTPGDELEIEACHEACLEDDCVVIMDRGAEPGDYARKINFAFRVLLPHEQWVFTGADDLCFCPEWDTRALACASTSHKPVIGTNDLGNDRVMRGDHSTHSLVHRNYVEQWGTCDERGKLYHEGYGHWFCDDEMVHTANVRGAFIACRESEVPHLHPIWGKGENDAVYEKGQASLWDDKALYEERQTIWLSMGRYDTVPSRV